MKVNHPKKMLQACKPKAVAKYYCTEHGKNHPHNTSDCFTLKNREKKNGVLQNNEKKKFSMKIFCKELNQMACSTPKKKLLELYEGVLAKEKDKLNRSTKCKAVPAPEASDLDDNLSTLLSHLP